MSGLTVVSLLSFWCSNSGLDIIHGSIILDNSLHSTEYLCALKFQAKLPPLGKLLQVLLLSRTIMQLWYWKDSTELEKTQVTARKMIKIRMDSVYDPSWHLSGWRRRYGRQGIWQHSERSWGVWTEWIRSNCSLLHQIQTLREPPGAALRIVGWELEMDCGDCPPNEGCTTRRSPSLGALQTQKMYRYSKKK